MDGRKQGQRLLIAHIVGYHHGLLAEGTVDGEGGIQHDTCFSGPVNILVGIADGDRSHGMGDIDEESILSEYSAILFLPDFFASYIATSDFLMSSETLSP